MRLRAYIAGPYRASTVNGIHENIQAARRVAVKALQLGFWPYCPHLNTCYMDGACPDSVFLEENLGELEKSDCIILVPGWERSSGTMAEIEHACKLEIPVFEYEVDTAEIAEFLKERKERGGK